MNGRTATALRVARLALLVSIVVYAAVLALALLVPESEALYVTGLVVSGWIALSAFACLILQAVLLVRWRRERRTPPRS